MPSGRARPADPALLDGSWLDVTNYYRRAAGLPDLVEDRELSVGSRLHAEYLVTNDVSGHDEDPARPGYTTEGAQGGKGGNVYAVSAPLTPRAYVEG